MAWNNISSELISEFFFLSRLDKLTINSKFFAIILNRCHKCGSLVWLLFDICDVELEFSKINVYLRNRSGKKHKFHDVLARSMFIILIFTWWDSLFSFVFFSSSFPQPSNPSQSILMDLLANLTKFHNNQMGKGAVLENHYRQTEKHQWDENIMVYLSF